MNFDLTNKSGTAVVNITLVEPKQLAPCATMMSRVFEEGYAMGHLVALLGPGERVGHSIVPEGMVGIGTVCSITLNGVLLKYGIPKIHASADCESFRIKSQPGSLKSLPTRGPA